MFFSQVKEKPMKYLPIFLTAFCVCFAASQAKAQFSAQKDAAYIATLKAVTDYKINDEENLDDIEKLRNDERFNRDLRRMLSKLDNRRSKTGENRRVYEILKKAGRDIYNVLK